MWRNFLSRTYCRPLSRRTRRGFLPGVERLEPRVNPDAHVGPLGQLLALNKEQFGPNEVISIDAGKIAFLTARDGKLTSPTGISDFLFPVADVYVVRVGRNVAPASTRPTPATHRSTSATT